MWCCSDNKCSAIDLQASLPTSLRELPRVRFARCRCNPILGHRWSSDRVTLAGHAELQSRVTVCRGWARLAARGSIEHRPCATRAPCLEATGPENDRARDNSSGNHQMASGVRVVAIPSPQDLDLTPPSGRCSNSAEPLKCTALREALLLALYSSWHRDCTFPLQLHDVGCRFP